MDLSYLQPHQNERESLLTNTPFPAQNRELLFCCILYYVAK